LKKTTILLCISFLSKASAEIPLFPPLEKGGRRGDLRKPFKKLNSYEIGSSPEKAFPWKGLLHGGGRR
jgi:hypothetical protein